MKKDCRLEIRLTKEELAEINKASDILKEVPSEYIRGTLRNRNKRVIAKAKML